MGLVTYSHYRFISASNIYAIPHEDVTYLEAQGCLHVSITPILNVFMSKYFAHIHLFLPLISAGNHLHWFRPVFTVGIFQFGMCYETAFRAQALMRLIQELSSISLTPLHTLWTLMKPRSLRC
jgi:hypothetical protein